MLTLENDHVRIAVKPMGAELCSLYNKKNNLEYLWQAGEAWPKHAPVLFPIVGQLKDNKYFHNGKSYTLPRHGFAREKNFSLIEEGPNRLVFRLMDDDTTHSVFPFHFIFEIEYALKEDGLMITYIVENNGSDKILFSVGAHPAFKVPLKEEDNYDDYYLEFDKNENAERFLLNNGLIASQTKPFLNQSAQIAINRELFNEDALIFKKLKSNSISIKSKKHNHGICFDLNNCPYLGLWSAKGGDFVCIEPWFGIADDENSDQQLINKKGIQTLMPGDQFSYSYTITLY